MEEEEQDKAVHEEQYSWFTDRATVWEEDRGMKAESPGTKLVDFSPDFVKFPVQLLTDVDSSYI